MPLHAMQLELPSFHLSWSLWEDGVKKQQSLSPELELKHRDIPKRGGHVHHENRSLIIRLALMRSAIRKLATLANTRSTCAHHASR